MNEIKKPVENKANEKAAAKPIENKPNEKTNVKPENKVVEKVIENNLTALQVQAQSKVSDIIKQVGERIDLLIKEGGLKLPTDYSFKNALWTAYTIITSPNKDNKILANICTKNSIDIALFGMVVRALNPLKDQVWFMAYNDRLKADPSYFGKVSLAKRVGMKEIYANIIYENDVFEFKVDTERGRQELIKHESKLENIDITKIKGAYAIYEMNDGRTNMEVMTFRQIKSSWLKGGGRGDTPAHRDTPDQMAKRTIIQRACKMIINTSDDSYLDKEEEDEIEDVPVTVIDQKANKELLNFSNATIIPEQPKEEHQPEIIKPIPVGVPTQKIEIKGEVIPEQKDNKDKAQGEVQKLDF